MEAHIKKSISIPKISISEDYLFNITKNAFSRLKVNIIHNRTALKLPFKLELNQDTCYHCYLL